MQNLLHIVLEAHNPVANHHRRYQISLGRDLLGGWLLSVCYGRVGSAGREERFAVESVEQARRIVLDRLRRRLSASRRIACEYELVRFSATSDFEPGQWIPEALGGERMTDHGKGRNTASGPREKAKAGD